jgi:two-component system sensor histidine kinase/response regulator
MLFETVGRFYRPPSLTSTLPSHAAEGVRRAGEAETPVADELPDLSSLDTNDGLSRVAGNRKLYLKLLRQFMEQQGPALGQISQVLARGDAALAERLAHTLKGVAGNIGAKPVQTAAGALEKAIRDRAKADEVESAKQQVAAVLDPLVAQLEAVSAFAPPEVRSSALTRSGPPEGGTPNQSREAAAQLTKLLSEFDPGAAEFLEANPAALRPLFPGDAWPQFEKLVQGYAFADAQTQLEQALKNLPAA